MIGCRGGKRARGMPQTCSSPRWPAASCAPSPRRLGPNTRSILKRTRRWRGGFRSSKWKNPASPTPCAWFAVFRGSSKNITACGSSTKRVEEAVRLSHRYLAGRQLPDKAISPARYGLRADGNWPFDRSSGRGGLPLADPPSRFGNRNPHAGSDDGGRSRHSPRGTRRTKDGGRVGTGIARGPVGNKKRNSSRGFANFAAASKAPPPNAPVAISAPRSLAVLHNRAALPLSPLALRERGRG